MGASPQVFGKGNTAFWIVFSVIHIISTLLLSTQLYYMGRWKLGEGMPRAYEGVGNRGYLDSQGTFDFSLAGGVTGWELRVLLVLSGLCSLKSLAPLNHGISVLGLLIADSGIFRRILHVLYTDCIRQCSGPLYTVPAQLPIPFLL